MNMKKKLNRRSEKLKVNMVDTPPEQMERRMISSGGGAFLEKFSKYLQNKDKNLKSWRKPMKRRVLMVISLFLLLFLNMGNVAYSANDGCYGPGGFYPTHLAVTTGTDDQPTRTCTFSKCTRCGDTWGWSCTPKSSGTSSSTSVSPSVSVTVPVTPSCSHDYQVTSQLNPTCTSSGYKIKTCRKCSNTVMENLSALGHNPKTSWESNETYHWKLCTRCGLECTNRTAHTDNNHDYLCDTCGRNLKRTAVISASPASVRVASGYTVSIMYEYNGDGTISVEPNNANVATAKLVSSSHTINIKGGSSLGTTYLAINAPETDNYFMAYLAVDVTTFAPNYQVGSEVYDTLQNAINAVPANTETEIIVLQSNVDPSNATIPSDKKVILNTNGKTITKTETSITNNGTLSIIGNGTIQTQNASDNAVGYLFTNASVLNISDATLLHQGKSTGSWGVINATAGSTTINSGTIRAVKGSNISQASYPSIVEMAGKANVNMSGGTIHSTLASSTAFNCMTTNSSGKLTISGGEITADTAIRLITMNGKIANNISMTGGTITGLSYGILTINASGQISVSGGTLTSTGSAISTSNTCSVSIAVIGGHVISTNGTAISYTGTGNLIVGTTGGKVDSELPEIKGTEYGIYTLRNYSFYDGVIKGITASYNEAPTTIENGCALITNEMEGSYHKAYLLPGAYMVSGKYYTFLQEAIAAVSGTNTIYVVRDVTDNSTAQVPYNKNITLDTKEHTITKTVTPIQIQAYGSLTVKGSGKVTASGINTLENSGSLYIDSNTVTIENTSSNYAILNTGSLEIYKGNVLGTNHVISNNKDAYIVGGNVIASTGVAIEQLSTGTLTVGTSGGGISQSDPVIAGQTYAITGNFKFYDGILKGVTGQYNGTISEKESNSGIHTGTEGSYKTAWLELEYSYQVGSTKYVTLENAIAAISGTGEIVVLQDVVDSSTATIASGKTITLNLNGKILTKTTTNPGASVNLITNNGTLKIQGAGTLNDQNDDIYNSYIYNTGNFEMTNVTVHGGNGIAIEAFLYHNASSATKTITITGSTITGTIGSCDIRIDGAATNTTISSSSIITGNSGVIKYNGAGNLTIKDDSLLQCNNGNIINMTSSGNLTVKSGRLISAGSFASFGIRAEATTTGSIVIEAGEIIAKGTAIEKRGTSTLTIGVQGGGVSTTSPVIQGDENGLSTNSYSFYDGIIKSKKIVYNLSPVAVEPGYGVVFGEEGEYQTATLQLGAITPVILGDKVVAGDFHVGDFVDYETALVPKSAIALATKTGHTIDQTIQSDTTTLWRVVDIDRDLGTLTLTTQGPIGSLTLKGAEGFYYGSSVMSSISDELYTTKYGTASGLTRENVIRGMNIPSSAYSSYRNYIPSGGVYRGNLWKYKNI